MGVTRYRDLRVWQAAMELVEQVSHLTKRFPTQEKFGLTSQMQRAAISVPSNLAEGHTREHRKEYLHHISMAQASLAELETHFEIAARLGYCSPGQRNQLLEHAASLGRQPYALRKALLKRGIKGEGSGV